MPLSKCTILQNPDGTYSITGTLQQIARIKRYQALPPSWQLRIDHMIDSVAAESGECNNIIQFPAPARAPVASA